MATVYANSALNLAAVDSSDSDTGLFFQGRAAKILSWRVEVDPTERYGPTAKITSWDCVPSSQLSSLDNSILHKRAWVFQERFLAPRSLNFGKFELSWECRTKKACEVSLCSAESETLPGISIKVLMAYHADQWFEIVSQYSKRMLTVPSDKLVALSGVARVFALGSGKTYVAGLWKEDLVRQLTWRTDFPKETIVDMYRAPSWSWASIDGPISMINFRRASQVDDSKLLVAIKEFFVENQNFGFDDGRGASIRLETRRLQPCYITTFNVKSGERGWGYNGRWVIGLRPFPEMVMWDPDCYTTLSADTVDFDPEGDFYLLPLIAHPTGTPGLLVSLLAHARLFELDGMTEVLISGKDSNVTLMR